MGGHLVQDKQEHREGALVLSTLFLTIKRHINGNLLDYGCGKGRLAHYCNPLTYLGYDINAGMVQYAQESNPDYCFTCSLAGALAYDSDCTLLYTVISMWDDDEAQAIMHQFRSRLIVIGEIADKRWETVGNAVPHIYNRDVEQIDALLANAGYKRIDQRKALHERYKSWTNDFDKFVSILVYERAK